MSFHLASDKQHFISLKLIVQGIVDLLTNKKRTFWSWGQYMFKT